MNHRLLARALFVAALPLAPCFAQGADAAWSPQQQKGLDFLMKHQKDGVFAVKMGERSHPDAGFTGLALAALQSKPAKQRSEGEQKAIDAGCKWLVAGQNED